MLCSAFFQLFEIFVLASHCNSATTADPTPPQKIIPQNSTVGFLIFAHYGKILTMIAYDIVVQRVAKDRQKRQNPPLHPSLLSFKSLVSFTSFPRHLWHLRPKANRSVITPGSAIHPVNPGHPVRVLCLKSLIFTIISDISNLFWDSMNNMSQNNIKAAPFAGYRILLRARESAAKIAVCLTKSHLIAPYRTLSHPIAPYRTLNIFQQGGRGKANCIFAPFAPFGGYSHHLSAGSAAGCLGGSVPRPGPGKNPGGARFRRHRRRGP
jgi:hypothetical protein